MGSASCRVKPFQRYQTLWRGSYGCGQALTQPIRGAACELANKFIRGRRSPSKLLPARYPTKRVAMDWKYYDILVLTGDVDLSLSALIFLRTSTRGEKDGSSDWWYQPLPLGCRARACLTLSVCLLFFIFSILTSWALGSAPDFIFVLLFFLYSVGSIIPCSMTILQYHSSFFFLCDPRPLGSNTGYLHVWRSPFIFAFYLRFLIHLLYSLNSKGIEVIPWSRNFIFELLTGDIGRIVRGIHKVLKYLRLVQFGILTCYCVDHQANKCTLRSGVME